MSVHRTTGPDPNDPFATHDAPAEPLRAPAPDDDSEHPLDMDKIRRYREIYDAEKAADAEADALKEERIELEKELVAMFAENGLQNLNVDGRTVFLHRTVFAQRKPGATAEDVVAALVADGAGDLVKRNVNANTLSAWVRELTEDDDAEGLPPHVAEVLEPGERFSVRVNAAGSARSRTRTHSH